MSITEIYPIKYIIDLFNQIRQESKIFNIVNYK